MTARTIRLLFLATMLCLFGRTASAANIDRLTLTGASPGGLWSMLGTGINNAVRASYANAVVTYQTSGGGLANIGILMNGKADIGIAHNIELKAAVDGTGPFKSPVKGLRAIAVMYNWAPMQMVVTKAFEDKYGVKSFKDIAAKKAPLVIAVNQRGNMVEAVNRAILEAYGISYKNLESWGGHVIYAPGKEMANLFLSRRIDMGGNGVFVPFGYFTQVAQNMDLDILPLDADVIKKVSEETGAEPYLIKAGGYPWLKHDVPTVALAAVLFTTDKMPNDEAYELTKSLIKNVDRIREVHKSMHALTLPLMASLKVIPYHPGAIRAYKEAGVMH
jgi:uncharacterized protein